MEDRWYRVSIVLASSATALLVRLLMHPVLEDRAVFLLPLLAVAISAHLAGLWAGLATMALTIPAAGLLFGAPVFSSTGVPGWVSALFSVALAVPLSLLGGRFHRMVREKDHALRRERAARAEAERASRARDEFLAVLSHELRSPLTAIVGWAQVLRQIGTTPDGERAIETILRSADHQVRLMSDISDLSRGSGGKLVLEPGFADVRAALEQAADAVRLAAEARRIKLQLVLPEAPLMVQGDLARLRQVFWNLLSNAIKFSPRGASVQATAARDGESVVVKVADSGQGIGADFLPHVFDSFRQEDARKARQQGGLGLGLAIVRHLVEAHGGTVRAQSDGTERGATFTVALPLWAGAPAEASGPGEAARPELNGLRILVVEDDRDTRELLTRSLGEMGASVVATASAAEARLEITKQAPDAIVSDIGLPNEDGLSFVRSLKRQPEHRRIPAIALTAYASVQDRSDALQAGYHEHLSKPIQFHQLARAIVTAVRPPG